MTVTPELQGAGSQSTSNSVGKSTSKSKTVEIEQEAEPVSDAESIISSEIEEVPLTSSQEQTLASNSSRLDLFSESKPEITRGSPYAIPSLLLCQMKSHMTAQFSLHTS